MVSSTEYQALASARASKLPLLGQLLRYAATATPLEPENRRFAWRTDGDDLRQFRWAVDAGLGALLHRATGEGECAVPAAWRQTLLGADLSARVRHGCLVDSMIDVIDACDGLNIAATLLKGISVSEELYPAEHLRPMGDVDVLIPARARAAVEDALLRRGYRALEFGPIEGFHHGAPLLHPQRGTVVELHVALFPRDSPLCTGRVFSLANIASQSLASRFHGRAACRLGLELQIVYIASSWFNDLTSRNRIHPSYLASLFDAAYLLAASGSVLNWDAMADWLDNDLARASMYALVTYLPRFGVDPVPSVALDWLASNHGYVGPIQLRSIHAVLDRYLIGGRVWNLMLPPPVPGRYSPRHQMNKRLFSRFRAIA